MTIILDGSEAEALALESGKPCRIIALSNDRQYTVQIEVSADQSLLQTIQLEPAASISGRLVDDSTGRPLAEYSVSMSYAGNNASLAQLAMPATTDSDGRFLVSGLLPGIRASASFHEPVQPAAIGAPHAYQDSSARDIVLRSGKVEDLGDLRIKRSAPKAD